LRPAGQIAGAQPRDAGPLEGIQGHPPLSRKLKFLVGASIIVLAVATLIYSAVRETSAYFMTVDEYARNPEAQAGKPLRIAGRVSSGSVKWDPKTLDLEFAMAPIPPKAADAHRTADGGTAKAAAQAAEAAPAVLLPVRYNGVLPDMFADGRDVIVEGKVEGGVFHAKSLLTTCPSKYESDQYKSEVSAGGTTGDRRAALDGAARVP
jgi:cytochrome c-type biogenesis protein CcmE